VVAGATPQPRPLDVVRHASAGPARTRRVPQGRAGAAGAAGACCQCCHTGALAHSRCCDVHAAALLWALVVNRRVGLQMPAIHPRHPRHDGSKIEHPQRRQVRLPARRGCFRRSASSRPMCMGLSSYGRCLSMAGSSRPHSRRSWHACVTRSWSRHPHQRQHAVHQAYTLIL